jgi:hypothetical protein
MNGTPNMEVFSEYQSACFISKITAWILIKFYIGKLQYMIWTLIIIYICSL